MIEMPPRHRVDIVLQAHSPGGVGVKKLWLLPLSLLLSGVDAPPHLPGDVGSRETKYYSSRQHGYLKVALVRASSSRWPLLSVMDPNA